VSAITQIFIHIHSHQFIHPSVLNHSKSVVVDYKILNNAFLQIGMCFIMHK
jgi:hypothetical protein